MSVAVLGVMSSPILGRVIKALLEKKVEICCVILDKKDWENKEKSIFEARTAGKIENINLFDITQGGVPFYLVQNHNSAQTVRILKKLKIDLLINSSTPRILKSEVLNLPKQGILNVHPGLLPSYRGCCCPEWAIYNNDQVGNTVHFMGEGIDEGPIVAKESIQLNENDSYIDMRVKLYQHGFALLANIASQLVHTCQTRHDFKHQARGNYYPIISSDKLELVKQRLEAGQYRYQI